MSDEIKRRVVLASVLKPVDDTRMFEKIGATLAEEGFEVFIIGQPSTFEKRVPGITLLPLPAFSRKSLKRLIIPWVIFQKINQVKPQIVIINSPELLLVTLLNKILFGRKMIYDVLENYYHNIRYSNVYPQGIKILLACFVRLTEIALSPFVDRFFLAEKGYVRELKFIKHPVVLENKLSKKVTDWYPLKRSSYHNLLFSGTLAPITGIFEAIRLCKELHAVDPAYNLTIIGYAAVPEVLTEIRRQLSDAPFITLTGGDELVPHEDIIKKIANAGTGIIIYPPNPGTESSIPTKLYEYLGLKLPVIISHTQDSIDLVQKCNAGIVLRRVTTAAILNEQLVNSSFTFDCNEKLFWESQSQALIEALKE